MKPNKFPEFCPIIDDVCDGHCQSPEAFMACGQLLQVLGHKVAVHAATHKLPLDMHQWPPEHQPELVDLVYNLFSSASPAVAAQLNPDTVNQALTEAAQKYYDQQNWGDTTTSSSE